MKMIFALLVAVAMAVSINSVVAQEVLQLPEVKPGTVYHYEFIYTSPFKDEVRESETQTVLSEGGGYARIKVVTNGGSSRIMTLDLTNQSFGNSKRSGSHDGIRFPLKLGDAWEWSVTFTDPDQKRTWELTGKFVGWETLELAANTFRTARIEHSGSWRSSLGWTGRLTRTLWYAPELGRFVQGRVTEFTRDNRIEGQEVFHLTNVELPGSDKAAVPAGQAKP